MSPEPAFVYVFHGAGARFSSGVFSSAEVAERWIRAHSLSGVLTRYPLDTGAFDYCCEMGLFRPQRPQQATPEFIGRFTSASLEHDHYEEGLRVS